MYTTTLPLSTWKHKCLDVKPTHLVLGLENTVFNMPFSIPAYRDNLK